MRKGLAILTLALSMCAAVPFALEARAQVSPGAPGASEDFVQIELTESMVKQYIAARAEIDDVLGDEAPEAGEPPDPKFVGRLEAIAKKFKFANYAEYDAVANNIETVLDGVDPATKTYVGRQTLIKREIEAAKADAKLPDEDRKATISELEQESRDVTPVKFPGNVELVLKYWDALNDGEPKAGK